MVTCSTMHTGGATGGFRFLAWVACAALVSASCKADEPTREEPVPGATQTPRAERMPVESQPVAVTTRAATGPLPELRFARLKWVSAGVAAIAVGLTATWVWNPPSRDAAARSIWLSQPSPPDASIASGGVLSPDGYYYEGIEYWIFSAPWLVHFADAWLHATGESLFELGPYRHWKTYVAHVLAPNGQDAFDFGDAWEGPLTRERRGDETSRLYPGGTLQSNANLLFGVAARLNDPVTQAVAERCRSFGHTSLEEHWTLLWRDPTLEAAPMSAVDLTPHFLDSGVFFYRSSWERDAIAIAFKAGPPEGRRAALLLPRVPEWRQSTGHAHPDAGSFIVWSGDRHVVGDTGYAGRPQARHHNTVVVGGFGQGTEREHDAWEGMDRSALEGIRILSAESGDGYFRVVAELAAAYPKQAGLLRFRRELHFDAPGRFWLHDRIATAEERSFEWFLHADRPFTSTGPGFADDLGGGLRLEGEVKQPADARATARPTVLMAPGRPGSIEQGRKDQRGYELVVEPSAPARAFEIGVVFELKKPKAP